MQQIGRRIFYEKNTGNVVLDTGEKFGSVVATTIAQDYENYAVLRGRENLGTIDLEYGEFTQDFAEANGVRVSLETGQLEFNYPDTNDPEAPPIFETPLSTEVGELRKRVALSEQVLDFLIMGGM